MRIIFLLRFFLRLFFCLLLVLTKTNQNNSTKRFQICADVFRGGNKTKPVTTTKTRGNIWDASDIQGKKEQKKEQHHEQKKGPQTHTPR
jgi:hypothetical protein